MSSPLVGPSGAPLDSKPAAQELVRPQGSPFPQLTGVSLTRIRPERNALPEAWRFLLAFRTGIGPEGRGLALDLGKGASGREVARGLRAVAAQLDALCDSLELPANDGNPDPAQVQPAES